MSSFPHLPLFTDAFIADTGHLTAQETGAYLMLLMVAWRTTDCRLPDNDDKLARWARVDRRTWLRIKPTVMEFWTLADGAWTQKRLSKEREIVSKRAEVARRNGEQGGRPKSLENHESHNPAGSSRVTQKKAPIPIPIPKEEEHSETSSLRVARKRKIDPDWTLGEAEVAAAEKAGVAAERAAEIWPQFIDHHTNKGTLGLDWLAGWRTWCRNEARFAPRDRPPRPLNGGQQPRPSNHVALDRLASRLEQRREQDRTAQRFADHGPVIDHEGDGPTNRHLLEPAGGYAGQSAGAAHLRIVGAGWR
jgi:uncharacterized protein YdaU (DUF1376 family)